MNENVFTCLEFIYRLSKKCPYEISRIDIFGNGKSVEFAVRSGDFNVMRAISIYEICNANFDIDDYILDRIEREFIKEKHD